MNLFRWNKASPDFHFQRQLLDNKDTFGLELIGDSVHIRHNDYLHKVRREPLNLKYENWAVWQN